MPDGVKSVLAALVLTFVMLVVLDGDIVRRTTCLVSTDPCLVAAGRRGISFCDGWIGGLPVLEWLPCFVLNLGVLSGIFAGIIAAFAAARVLRGSFGD
jgi:hypothetical protein